MSDEMPDRLLNSRNYRDVCPDTVMRIWEDCRSRYRKPKDAEKAAREALHGITGAFMTPQETRQLAYDMHQWHCNPTDSSLERMLGRHASTRERLPVSDMDATLERLFAITGRPRSVLDLACGINPIYLGARGIPTVGVDISGAATDAVNRFHEIYHAPVRCLCADLLCPGSIPREHFDVALLLKLLPLLDRQREGAAVDTMLAVDTQWLVASFPTRTLGGRNVGMAAHYTQWMKTNIPDGHVIEECLETPNELYFVLRRSRAFH